MLSTELFCPCWQLLSFGYPAPTSILARLTFYFMQEDSTRVCNLLPYPLHSMRRIEPVASRRSFACRMDGLTEKGLHRFVKKKDGNAWHAALRKLSWDSDFFGLNVGRIEYLGSSSYRMDAGNLKSARSFIKDVKDFASEQEIEYLTIQVDSADALLVAALQLDGFIMLDTIVCYLLNLGTHVSERAELVRSASDRDIPALSEISRSCFSDPSLNANRFNCDPLLAPEKVAELYSLWAQKSVTGEMAHQTLVFDNGNGPLGFITIDKPSPYDVVSSLNLASIPLNAVAPEHHGQGIYGSLVGTALDELKLSGVEWVDIRTQLPNTAVHKTWQKLGAIPVFSYYTFRFFSGRGQ